MKKQINLIILMLLLMGANYACSVETSTEPSAESNVVAANDDGNTDTTSDDDTADTTSDDDISDGTGDDTTAATCSDGIQNQDETGVDCGGSCSPCIVAATCSDGIQNQDETGVDCGGTCIPCGDDLEEAIKTGNPAFLTGYETILQAAIDETAAIETRAGQALQKIYGDNMVSFAPGQQTQLIVPKDSINSIPLVVGNQGMQFAGLVEKDNNRFGAIGSYPFFDFVNGTQNLDFDTPLANTLLWLAHKEQSDTGSVSVAVTMTSAYIIYETVETWIKGKYSSWTVTQCAEMSSLESCYADKDLIIVGAHDIDGTEVDIIKSALEKSISSGSSVFYVHYNTENYSSVGNAVLDLMGFHELPHGGNYYAIDAANYTNYQAMLDANNPVKKIKDLLIRFRDKTFNVDMSACAGHSCTDNIELNAQFQNAANAIRGALNEYDRDNENIFLSDGNRLMKTLVLLGDKLRESVAFPIDKVTTDNSVFFKSLFADYSVLNSRAHNPVQKDMGTFGRSDFSHITPINKSVSMVSRIVFRSAGVYALPGKVVKVTRTDNNAVKTSVFINSLRAMSTQQFSSDPTYNRDCYNRPKFLQSAWIEIEPGETVNFSSPYGGPIQVAFDTNDLSVSFDFENVGEHPYWASTADSASFAQKLETDEYDWAEIATKNFEVHSTREKMLSTIQVFGTPDQVAAATVKYMSNYPFVLAGFQGDGIDIVPELTNFAATKGWTIDSVAFVQHMNADQPSCGYGCSGNPYDAGWAYSVIGHGDIHELGHNIESRRMRFAGWVTHATTNLYVYYTQSEFWKATNLDPAQLPMDFAAKFKDIFNALNSGNGASIWSWPEVGDAVWSTQFTFYLQSAMSVQKMGKLANGWHLFGRLHMLEREFNRSLVDAATWDAKKASLGFSSYSLDEAKAITNNDWMLVAMSFVSELDFRDYLLMWGLPYSLKAADQVVSFALTPVPRRYFISTNIGFTSQDQYGTLLDKQYLEVNGSSIWPAE